MASKTVLEWCSKKLQGSPNAKTMNNYLQDIDDKQVREVIQTKEVKTWNELVGGLLKREKDKTTRAHLLGYENLEEQQEMIERVKALMRRKK